MMMHRSLCILSVPVLIAGSVLAGGDGHTDPVRADATLRRLEREIIDSRTAGETDFALLYDFQTVADDPSVEPLPAMEFRGRLLSWRPGEATLAVRHRYQLDDLMTPADRAMDAMYDREIDRLCDRLEKAASDLRDARRGARANGRRRDCAGNDPLDSMRDLVRSRRQEIGALRRKREAWRALREEELAGMHHVFLRGLENLPRRIDGSPPAEGDRVKVIALVESIYVNPADRMPTMSIYAVGDAALLKAQDGEDAIDVRRESAADSQGGGVAKPDPAATLPCNDPSVQAILDAMGRAN